MAKGFLKNDFVQVEYLTDALRISGLVPTGKSNLLVELPDSVSVVTPYGKFYFHGGHRLWHAPEAMPRTYIPDSQVQVTDLPDGVLLDTQTEQGSGIRKQIQIQLAKDQPSIRLTHVLVNDGLWPVELAAWGVTQFRLGGTVILPMPAGNADAAGLLHNRQFSLWPYTRIDDPRLKLDDRFILFQAEPLLPPFKIGTFNSHGWMAYWLDGVLFRKSFIVQKGPAYPDNNCNVEMYCNDQFVELESLGSLTKLSPGESLTHIETWDILNGIEALPVDAQEMLRR